LQQIFAEEVAGQHFGRDQPADFDWDAKTLVEGILHPERPKPVRVEGQDSSRQAEDVDWDTKTLVEDDLPLERLKEEKLESGREGNSQRSGKMLVTSSLLGLLVMHMLMENGDYQYRLTTSCEMSCD
jgi:hypothetical protein